MKTALRQSARAALRLLARVAQLRHRWARRRLVERIARRFISRTHATRLARRIP